VFESDSSSAKALYFQQTNKQIKTMKIKISNTVIKLLLLSLYLTGLALIFSNNICIMTIGAIVSISSLLSLSTRQKF